MRDRNAVLSKLRQRGWRITPQRLAIIEFLEGNTNHPSALEIFQALKPLYPSLSPTTVYSTLHVLKELGEVVEISGGTEGNRYDPNVHPHANLICL
ncbi:MAG: transcriptional repressor, partial [Nitrospinota bacterium]